MEAVAETGNATPCALLAMGTLPQSGESLYKWLQTRASDAGILHRAYFQSQIFALRAGHCRRRYLPCSMQLLRARRPSLT